MYIKYSKTLICIYCKKVIKYNKKIVAIKCHYVHLKQMVKNVPTV